MMCYGLTHPLGRPKGQRASNGKGGGQNATLHFGTALLFFLFLARSGRPDPILPVDRMTKNQHTKFLVNSV